MNPLKVPGAFHRIFYLDIQEIQHRRQQSCYYHLLPLCFRLSFCLQEFFLHLHESSLEILEQWMDDPEKNKHEFFNELTICTNPAGKNAEK